MEKIVVSQIKHNPRAFYAYAKRFQKTFSGVGPIINKDGVMITDPAEIAEIQKEQYEKGSRFLLFLETKFAAVIVKAFCCVVSIFFV